MNPIKKTLFTLNVDNYAPEICELTYPLMKRYAEKIGASFCVITERKYPEFAPVYEKVQIREIAAQLGSDWNIYFDSDALIHPECIDFTSLLSKDTVLHNSSDMASNRWKYDEYFLRDGRNIGSCNWFTIASDWCLDLWTPLDIPLTQALDHIYPTQIELASGIKREHLIDDYTLSRNIARYGLKFRKALDVMREAGIDEKVFYFWHQYTIPIDEKVIGMRKMIRAWGV